MEVWESVERALEWGSLCHNHKRAPAIPYFLLARREFILGQRCARWWMHNGDMGVQGAQSMICGVQGKQSNVHGGLELGAAE